MGERRKQATLLFCDMAGSTSMGEELDPEAVRELMFRYFHEMRSAIEGHGGTVEKFIGDAVMAVFGVPRAHEDDALRAVRAAAEMRARLTELNEEFGKRFGRRISLRIGVNTGEVVAGDPTSGETVVTGDAVNVAARLEQGASAGEILIGDPTMDLVKGAVSVEPVAPLIAKGKAEPVPAYRLLSVVPAAVPIPRGDHVGLVGRREELAALEAEYATVLAAGSCRLVTVTGEPGVGKSRLAAEFVRTAEEAAVVQGRCLSYGEGITYWPLAEMVRAAAGILDEDSPERARERIAALLGEADRRDVAAGYLAAAIGLARGEASPEGIAWACRVLFESIAAHRPLVVLLDDLHWAEAPLLDLLRRVERQAERPILLLCLARPELLESSPGWHADLRLEPLAPHDVERLVERILGGGSTPPTVLAQIATTSGGNALFAEELVAKLRDDGVLEHRDGGWVTTRDSSEIEMPSTLSAVLADRLDRLEERERTVLEVGAVEGEIFHRGAASAVSEAPILEVSQALEDLVGIGLVRAAAAAFEDDAAFRFRHILLRDAAYAALPKGTRARWHERYADWLERTADRVEEHEEIVGYHLEQAFRYRGELWTVDDEALALARRAAAHLASAGGRAIGRRDHHAALRLLGRALELLQPTEPTRLEVLADLADALVDAGDFTRADELHLEVIDGAGAAGNLSLRVRAQLRRLEAGVHAGRRSTEDALRESEDLLPICERLADDGLLGHAWAIVGRMRFWMGAAAESQVAYERAIEHASRAGDHRREHETLAWLIGAMAHGPAPAPQGIAFCDEVLAADPEDPLLTLFAYEKRGWLLAMLGRFDEARDSVEAARRVADRFDLKVRLAMTTFYGASIELLADGDLDRAERELREADELLGSVGERAFRSSIALCLGRVLERRGRLEEAEGVLSSIRDQDPELVAFRARLIAARWDPQAPLARRGNLELAERLARDAVEDARTSDYLDVRGETLVVLAEILLLGGSSADAADALREAIEVHDRKGNVVSAERARRKLASLREAAPADGA